MTTTERPDVTAMVNARLGGWNNAMGLRWTRVTADEVVGEVTVGEQHLQPYGIVHGGVHAGIIEAACSVGGAVWAMTDAGGKSVVGLENSTSFLRAARGGKLRVTARPVVRGRRSQVWEAVVDDGEGRALATGRVRLICLEPEADLAGKKVTGPDSP